MNYKYKYLKYKNKYLNTKKNITRGGGLESTNSTLANDDDNFSTFKSPEETWQTQKKKKIL